MSNPDGGAQPRLDAEESVRNLIDHWVETLAQVLESMTDQKPDVRWQAASGAHLEVGPPPGTEVLWWEQKLSAAPEAAVWVGAQRSAWEHVGSATLKAAGLETVELAEARNTWFEILGQSLGALARAVGAILGREVTAGPGTERTDPPAVEQWASVYLAFGDEPLPPLMLALSPELTALISAPPPQSDETETLPMVAESSGPSPMRSRTMDLLLEVDLPVTISFGKAQLAMKDVLKLTTGSIVELNRGINDPVEVLVNHCLIARGEVVVVEGNYGVKISEIASRPDRLRSIR
jgi:flagellar motor switch protein FliN/FliY